MGIPKSDTTDRRRGLRWGRHIGKGLYALIVLVFLTGYTAAYLSPSWFWWTGLVAPAVPYAAMLLVASMPLVLWRSGGRGRLLAAFVLVLVVMRFAPPLDWVGPAEEEQGDLTLMSFNAPVRGPSPDSLAGATVDLVRTVQPDVLALQEPLVWWEDVPPARRITRHVQALVDSLGYTAPRQPVEGVTTRMEQPVLSRKAVEETRQILLGPGGGGSRASYVTRTRFRWQGREAVLYNVHLYTTGEKKPWQASDVRLLDPSFWLPYLRHYHEAYLQRAREVQHLRTLLEDETLPTILAGDFNSTVHHWEYRHLKHGMQNAFMHRGRGWGATYHSRLPLVRIDHILVSDEWEVVSAYVSDRHGYSDHRPVVARLRWRR